LTLDRDARIAPPAPYASRAADGSSAPSSEARSP
jgi:hypothetical protein